VTARDLQKTDGQWARAKGFDTFCPLGAMVPAAGSTRAAASDRPRERRGAAGRHAAEMAFPIAVLIAYISAIMTLEPGDVIATGTPAGVGPLQPGDVVEVEIVGVGVSRNPVVKDEEL
jgi:2-keto-4-pentenoate hydratase/2-oxohepta-3-ene-1,7-dioic acid hydratase in catechol pathway